MDLSPEREELKIPLLGNSSSRRELRNRIRSVYPYMLCVAGAIAFVGLFVMCVLDDDDGNHQIQPQVELNSLYICPTIRGSVIWDLNFDLINTEKDSNFCLNKGFGFKVSVFPYNQSSLLTKAFATPVSPRVCIVPGNRTSLVGLVEDGSTSIQDLINDYFSDDDDQQPINGTIRLDLQLHNHDYDLVCGDAKVELSSSISNSSLLPYCGSMVGDPFACSYQNPPHPPSTQCRLLVCASPFLLLLAALVIAGIIVSIALFVIVKCR